MARARVLTLRLQSPAPHEWLLGGSGRGCGGGVRSKGSGEGVGVRNGGGGGRDGGKVWNGGRGGGSVGIGVRGGVRVGDELADPLPETSLSCLLKRQF